MRGSTALRLQSGHREGLRAALTFLAKRVESLGQNPGDGGPCPQYPNFPGTGATEQTLGTAQTPLPNFSPSVILSWALGCQSLRSGVRFIWGHSPACVFGYGWGAGWGSGSLGCEWRLPRSPGRGRFNGVPGTRPTGAALPVSSDGHQEASEAARVPALSCSRSADRLGVGSGHGPATGLCPQCP